MNNNSPLRNAVFISHANPEDNEFTVWLGAHLSGAGYEVWADVLRLKGGQDWARKLEDALRNKAIKVLLVGTRVGMEKQGVRNEIQIATDVAKKLGDTEFIIPLKIQGYDPPFHIVQTQYIDFMKGWGEGLADLLEALEGYDVPRSKSFDGESITNYRNVQLMKSSAVISLPEELISNWIRISDWPNTIQYFSFKGLPSEDQAKRVLGRSGPPTFLFRQGFITFAEEDDFRSSIEILGPINLEKRWSFRQFLAHGDNDLPINFNEVKTIVSHLTKSAFEQSFSDRKLHRYDYSGGVCSWWIPSGLIPDGKVHYKWDHRPAGRRHMTGEVNVRGKNYKWHYGLSVKPWISRNSHIRLIPRIIFTLDGHLPIEDTLLMHRLRRSVPRSWRNARWRDLILAFLYWFSGGQQKVLLKTGSTNGITIDLPTISMISPVSIRMEAGEDTEDAELEAEDPVFDADFEHTEESEHEA